MWLRFLYLSFFCLFLVDNVFATDKAINAAKDYFTKETDLTWITVAGGVIVFLLIIWLIRSTRKNAKEK